jgi:hypothetical protein
VALVENEQRVFLLAMVVEIFFANSAAPPVETAPAAMSAKFAMQNGHMLLAPY